MEEKVRNVKIKINDRKPFVPTHCTNKDILLVVTRHIFTTHLVDFNIHYVKKKGKGFATSASFGWLSSRGA